MKNKAAQSLSAKAYYEEWRAPKFGNRQPWPYAYHSEVCEFAEAYAKRKAPQSLAESRWARIPKEERAQPPHNPTGIGGRPRKYPPCPRYAPKAHQFRIHADGVDRCPCGFTR